MTACGPSPLPLDTCNDAKDEIHGHHHCDTLFTPDPSNIHVYVYAEEARDLGGVWQAAPPSNTHVVATVCPQALRC